MGLETKLRSVCLVLLAIAATAWNGSAVAQEAKATVSREDFDRERVRIATDAAARHAESMAARLKIGERDREYVEQEVRKRVERGQSEAEALDEVVGTSREERIAKAYRRLLEVHIPTEADREQIAANFAAVKAAIASAGFTPDAPAVAVPFIESGYRPKAFNMAHRINETVKGMWQFTESTARDHGLKVTTRGESEAATDTDERYDPAKSSVAAKAYLDMLQGRDFASGCIATPALLLASYHMGQGNVDRKVESHGCDFWAWPKDGKDGFGTHSYNYPALVLAGQQLLNEMELML